LCQHMAHSSHYALIACTAAEITRNCLSNRVVAHVWVRVILQESVNCHEEARRAKTTLKPMMIVECLLQWMKGSVDSKALNGRDLGAIFHNRERQTGVDPPSLDQNGTRTALAVIAAFLCAGQLEAIA